MLSTGRTYLRVRRPRSATAADAIYLQGLDQSQQSHDQDYHNSLASKRIAVWRRVAEPEDHSHVRKRDCRVLDAVLEEDAMSTSDSHHDGDTASCPVTKRRRLTLLPLTANAANPYETILNKPSSPKQRNNSRRSGTTIRILDPAERLVDDSLQQVFQGTVSVAQHYRMITSDARLADQRLRWCAWQNAELGSLLHACALWNEYEILQELLQLLLQHISSTDSTHAASLILDIVDGDGRTPFQIGELSGHDQVCQVLQAHGAGDYLVDLYALDDPEDLVNNGDDYLYDDVNTLEPPDLDDESSKYLACELKGGVGYWNEQGQLILQHAPPHSMSNVSLRDEDESVDSNHEDWDGNDYPDFDDGEDAYDNPFMAEDSDAQDMPEHPGCRSPSAVIDSHGDFDAAYGVYGQHDTEDYDDEI